MRDKISEIDARTLCNGLESTNPLTAAQAQDLLDKWILEADLGTVEFTALARELLHNYLPVHIQDSPPC